MDGQNWDKVHTFTELNHNDSTKEIVLPEAVEAKYLKLAVTDTYGNSDGERNKFISGSMLNFYEDTTKEYKADVKIEYFTENKTNKDVTAKLILPKDCVAVGETEHIFKDNGTFEFKYIDANKVEQSIIAEVNNIDRELPTMTYTFDNESLTNKDVTLTITEFSKANVRVVDIKEENSVVNPIVMARAINGNTNVTPNVYPNTYTFTENKTVVFTIADEAGNVNTIPVTVNWIDKDAPTADIQYDNTNPTNGQVKATLVNASEDITITNLPQGQDYYVFDKNGSFTFEFVDKAGNKGSAIANINWFDFNDIKTILQYEDVVENDNSSSDEVKLSVDEEKVEILNNNGSNEVKFVKNGVFKFRARMIDTGEEFDIMVEVDWLAETAAEDESPIEIPTVDDSNDGNGNDLSNDSEDDSNDEDDNTNDNPSVDDSDNSGDNDTSEENPDLDPDFGVDYEEEETPVEPPIEEPIAPPVNPDNNGGANNGDTTGSNLNGEGNSSNNDSVNNSNNSLSNGELNNDKVTSNNLNSNTNNTNNSNSNTVSVSSNNVNSTGANVSYSEEVQINDSNKEFNTALSDKESNRELETNASSDLTSSENSSEDFIEESENIDNSIKKGLVATIISFITGLFGMIFAWFRKLF